MSKPNQFSYLPSNLVNEILEKIVVFLPQEIKITLKYKYPGYLNDFELNLEWLNDDSNQFPFKNKLQKRIKEMKGRTNTYGLGYPGAFGHVIKDLKGEFKENFKMRSVKPRSVSVKTAYYNNSSNNNNSNNNNNYSGRVETRTVSQFFELKMLKKNFNVRSTSKRFLGSVKRLENSKRQQNSKSKSKINSKINSKNKSKSRN